MPTEPIVWSVILLVACLTAASRFAGPVLMLRVTLSPPLERFLDGASVCVIAALVASLVAQADLRTAVSVAVASLIMLGSKSAIWSMLSGMTVAAVWLSW